MKKYKIISHTKIIKHKNNNINIDINIQKESEDFQKNVILNLIKTDFRMIIID